MQHAGVEALADEVAGLVDGDAVRRRGMTGHDEDPLETVLRDLSADIRNERSQVECRMPNVPGWTTTPPISFAPVSP